MINLVKDTLKKEENPFPKSRSSEKIEQVSYNNNGERIY